MEWEVVIGLEIHAQLATKSKIFSGSSTAYGAEANTQANAVDLGLPGVLPVFNEEALRMAVKFGLAIDAEIGLKSIFDRKNYFYPDSPKGYQTTQLHHPIVGMGHIDIELEGGVSKRINVTRAHLEEDAGKSVHEGFAGMSGIDLNRAGTPLIEIVSEPEMRTAKEAAAYFKKMHSIVTYLGICDGDLSQGSMRCDCNVSLRPKGQEEFGTRTEIKNVNSFRNVERAINTEIQRQMDVLEDGGVIRQETRLYDADKDETRAMRSKEVENDYRYFPCPDLLPVIIDQEYVEAVRATLPELPDAKKARFQSEHGLSLMDAAVLSSDRIMADYFEAAAKISGDYKIAANWVMGDVSAALNKNEIAISDIPVSAEQLGALLSRIKDNTLSNGGAKEVFNALWEGKGTDVDALIDSLGLKQVSDTGAIEEIVAQVLADNPKLVEGYLNTPEDKRAKAVGPFIGLVRKAAKGVNPQVVMDVLQKKLSELG
ncbi:Asp-tRNA(Asn)/Glu-tRNA(Gln) amidotransferase subunit GatB [Thalassolituus oleivorans]|jgi:aspartyl-tRNA(Asn)/glutamyl-tRNA(Gln) amidotransferase subunit B|uniref:Aspartyl/glutamyl-tRNA(Asn/Gln) amidotransferase subunit B n=1 Tax=Thalassolituus oleivorans MIL-1 TaxID=1298593 RepID=M5DVS9_9GAMM|nr:Asp-tRNA(Asn)/Glu-tRNA(Gln) amidotransferase subunit GatB [Thalassolituus oleivorans]MCA6128089.1 glutamyl-tRNA amidotransferase [Thalassolituus oleivorans 4BN06-13]MDF1641003.1 Asp-tRNA(Asn)/Glu-tRNA(Gln) amidotransferase subunit GatB [Thalassolituus oleivorans]CCU73512.1 aspartyl/glutamyl-tRNA amidotransferase subunit B [Thalassolituus oleivorans MIL-1]